MYELLQFCEEEQLQIIHLTFMRYIPTNSLQSDKQLYIYAITVFEGRINYLFNSIIIFWRAVVVYAGNYVRTCVSYSKYVRHTYMSIHTTSHTKRRREIFLQVVLMKLT